MIVYGTEELLKNMLATEKELHLTSIVIKNDNTFITLPVHLKTDDDIEVLKKLPQLMSAKDIVVIVGNNAESIVSTITGMLSLAPQTENSIINDDTTNAATVNTTSHSQDSLDNNTSNNNNPISTATKSSTTTTINQNNITTNNDNKNTTEDKNKQTIEQNTNQISASNNNTIPTEHNSTDSNTSSPANDISPNDNNPTIPNAPAVQNNSADKLLEKEPIGTTVPKDKEEDTSNNINIDDIDVDLPEDPF